VPASLRRCRHLLERSQFLGLGHQCAWAGQESRGCSLCMEGETQAPISEQNTVPAASASLHGRWRACCKLARAGYAGHALLRAQS